MQRCWNRAPRSLGRLAPRSASAAQSTLHAPHGTPFAVPPPRRGLAHAARACGDNKRAAAFELARLTQRVREHRRGEGRCRLASRATLHVGLRSSARLRDTHCNMSQAHSVVLPTNPINARQLRATSAQPRNVRGLPTGAAPRLTQPPRHSEYRGRHVHGSHTCDFGAGLHIWLCASVRRRSTVLAEHHLIQVLTLPVLRHAGRCEPAAAEQRMIRAQGRTSGTFRQLRRAPGTGGTPARARVTTWRRAAHEPRKGACHNRPPAKAGQRADAALLAAGAVALHAALGDAALGAGAGGGGGRRRGGLRRRRLGAPRTRGGHATRRRGARTVAGAASSAAAATRTLARRGARRSRGAGAAVGTAKHSAANATITTAGGNAGSARAARHCNQKSGRNAQRTCYAPLRRWEWRRSAMSPRPSLGTKASHARAELGEAVPGCTHAHWAKPLARPRPTPPMRGA